MIKAANDALWDGKQKITNFLPMVTRLFVENGDSTKTWFHLQVFQDGNQTTLVPIPYGALDTLRFDKISPAFLCIDENGASTDTSVRQYLRREIASRMREECPGIFFARMGWNKLPDGAHVYIAGNRVIGDTGAVDYALALSLQHIQLPDMEGSDSELLRKFLKTLKKQSDILIPLTAYCVRSLLITPFDEAGYPLRFVLYLMGQQGLGKTTTAQKFALPFDQCAPVRSPLGMIDAGSTPSALREAFSALRDVPTVLDDVAISTDTREQQKRKNTVADLVRFVANDTSILRMRGSQTQNLRSRCGMIVTAELPLETASDITRCATVVLFDQMNSLTRDDRALAAAAMSLFLSFFSKNYDRLVEKIRRELNGVGDTKKCPRQQQIYRELEVCFQLLLHFGQSLEVVDEIKCEKWHKRIEQSLSLMLAHNSDLIKNLKTRNLEDLASRIVDAIEENKLRIAKNCKKFSQNPDAYDGLKSQSTVCILPGALTTFVNQITGRSMTENALGKHLRACGLVESNAENRTAAWKRKGLPRMIPFHLETLQKQAKKD